MLDKNVSNGFFAEAMEHSSVAAFFAYYEVIARGGAPPAEPLATLWKDTATEKLPGMVLVPQCAAPSPNDLLPFAAIRKVRTYPLLE